MANQTDSMYPEPACYLRRNSEGSDPDVIIGKSHHEVSGTCSQLLLVSSVVVLRVQVHGNGVIIEIK